MTYSLLSNDIWALDFITFAPCGGVSNIISSSMVGRQAAEHAWCTAAVALLGTCANTVSLRGLA
ncbi:hypothetical protein [Xenorhabdus poinarii]|uniref:hypothetical protein n=1 Tax=Xenorhabdus poinarii TaxID=40577 RepID=UPI0005F9CCB0|nr:hypothetical protein [Xenorhabdus poinarii]